jgi:hypothetical protein
MLLALNLSHLLHLLPSMLLLHLLPNILLLCILLTTLLLSLTLLPLALHMGVLAILLALSTLNSIILLALSALIISNSALTTPQHRTHTNVPPTQPRGAPHSLDDNSNLPDTLSPYLWDNNLFCDNDDAMDIDQPPGHNRSARQDEWDHDPDVTNLNSPPRP